jgi:hypothetical protein
MAAVTTAPPDFTPQIPADKLKKYQIRFKALARGKQYLGYTEANMTFLDYGLRRENVAAMWARVDANGNRRLDHDEFCHAMFLIDTGAGNALPPPPAADPPPAYGAGFGAGGVKKSMLDIGGEKGDPVAAPTGLPPRPDGAPPSYDSTQASSSKLVLPAPVILNKPKVLICRKCNKGLAPGQRIYYCKTCGDRNAYCQPCSLTGGGCSHRLPTVRWELGANWPVHHVNNWQGDCQVCSRRIHTDDLTWRCSRCIGRNTCESCWTCGRICSHARDGYVKMAIMERSGWW